MESVPQVLSQDTYASYGVILSGLGGGGGSAVSSFLDLYSVSTITSTLLVQAEANILNLNAGSISTIYLQADEGYISSISTLGVVLDGAVLTTAGGSELLLNGVPVATTANLSSLSDWSKDPAISTLNMNGNNLIAGASGTFQNLTATSSIFASNMFLSTLSSGVVNANAVNVSSISTGVLNAQTLAVGSVSTGSVFAGFVSTSSTFTSAVIAEGTGPLFIGTTGINANIKLFNTVGGVPDGNTIFLSTNALISDSETVNINVVSLLTADTNEIRLNAAANAIIDTPHLIVGNPAFGTTLLDAGAISSFDIYVQNGMTVGSGGNVNLSGLGSVVTPNIEAPEGSQLDITGVANLNGFVIPPPPGEVGGTPGILQINGLSTINGVAYSTSNLTTSSITTAALTASSINGVVFPQPVPDVSQWATFAASSNVNLNGKSLIDSQGDLTVSATNGNLNLVDDKGINLLSGSVVNMTARNGNGGTVNILADSGTGFVNGGVVNVTANGGGGPAGLFGRVSVVAQPGSALGVDTGGVVELIANSGTSLSNATSKITLNAGGINIYSGIASPFASLFGYTYLNASLGISLVAGGFTSGFQSPGTVYLYGYDGIVLGATTYASQISGVWNGLSAPSNLVLTGRQTLSGNSHVVVSNVDSIFFDTGYGALSGVSSINGQAYPPVLEPTPNIDVSTITVNPAGYISTAQIFGVSTINGEAYPPVLEPTPNIEVSTVTVNTEGYISASRLYISTINDEAYPPVLEPTPNIEVSTVTVNTEGYISASRLYISTINDEAYPPVLEPTPNIDVSTITVNPAGYISTAQIFGVSTINGEAYPPVLEPTPNIDVSTVTVNTEGYISASRLYISSINDEAYPPVLEPTPNITVSTVTVNPDGYIYTNTITNPIGNINDMNITQDNGVAGLYLKLNTVANLGITGGGEIIMNSTITGGVKLDATGNTLEFLTSGALKGQIVGLSTINGAAYPPTFEPTPNIEVSTVTVAPEGFVSTTQLLGVSSIFGTDYLALVNLNADGAIQMNSNFVISNFGHVLTFSTVTEVATFVGQIEGLSTINGAAYPPTFEPTPNIDVSTVTVNTEGYISASRLYISTINDAVYPPAPPALPSNIEASTVTVNTAGYISASQLFISSINNAAYPPPPPAPTPGIEASTVTVNAVGYVSASRLYVSSINDTPFPNANPQVSTLTVAPTGVIEVQALSTLTTINGQPYYPNNPLGNNFSSITVNSAGFVSTPSVLGLSNIVFSPDASVTSMSNLGGMITSGNADFVLQTPAGTARKIFLQTTSTSMQMTGAGDIFFNNKNNSYVQIDNNANLFVSKGALQVSSITGLSSINGLAYIPGGAGGVESVNGSPGQISIISGDGISVTTVGSTITVTNTSPPSPDGVAKLNGLYGELNISSISNEIIITPGGTNIDLALNPVQTLSSLVINPDGFVSTSQIEGLSSILAYTSLDINSGISTLNFQNLNIRNFCSTGSIFIESYSGTIGMTNNDIYLNAFATGTSRVFLQNASTSLTVGTEVSILPELGLFFDTTRLLFNNQDLLTPDPVFSTVTASTIYTQVVQDGLSKGGATLTLSSNQVFLDTGSLSKLALDNTNFLLESAAGPSVATDTTRGLVLSGYNNTTATSESLIALGFEGGINISTLGCALNLEAAGTATLASAGGTIIVSTTNAFLALGSDGLIKLDSHNNDLELESGGTNILVASDVAPETAPLKGLSVYTDKLGFNGVYIPQTLSGFIPYATQASRFVSTPIAGLTSTGLVMAQYNNSYSTISSFSNKGYSVIRVEPGTDSCFFQLDNDISIYDTVIWNVLNFGTGPYAEPPAEVAPEEPPPLESV